MSRYDLTDFEWRVIEPLLPKKSRGGSEKGGSLDQPPTFSELRSADSNLGEGGFATLQTL
ncbi:hypothetical protein [Altericroceibacterium endophyticum]|uniref:Transposase n=1 Tax=Altericroceibacterium endophyticum TaxID=1808508 RepID=A0A6I4T6C5_9SPHN|nr:hypothetical protein [Altericroceibacterium endophyticum]MXO66228.1 hypothetical protein [Altericroceibacterium endophyticum]